MTFEYKMKKLTALLFIVLIFPSCASIQLEAAKERINAECPPEKKGTMAKRNRCVRDISIAELPSDPALSLLVESYDALIPVSEQFDKGKISEERYMAIKSDIKARLDAKIASHEAQARAQAWANVGQSMQEYSRQQAANRPRTTNCIAGPYSATCTTY